MNADTAVLLVALAVQETATGLGIDQRGFFVGLAPDRCVGLVVDERVHSSSYECRFCGSAGGMLFGSDPDDLDDVDASREYYSCVQEHARLGCVRPRDVFAIAAALTDGLPARSAVRWAAYLRVKAARGETPISLAMAVEQKRAALAAGLGVAA